MALFRRNKAQQNTIPELQEYYNAERRERSGLSWLLALVSVACAALLVIGLVFGGKWLYRKLAHNMDNNKTETAQTENKPANQPETPAETEATPPAASSDTTATPTPAATQTPATSTSTPATSTPASATTPATTTTPAASSGAVASSSPLPHTGPANTIAIFIATAVLATFIRYTVFKRKFQG